MEFLNHIINYSSLIKLHAEFDENSWATFYVIAKIQMTYFLDYSVY